MKTIKKEYLNYEEHGKKDRLRETEDFILKVLQLFQGFQPISLIGFCFLRVVTQCIEGRYCLFLSCHHP